MSDKKCQAIEHENLLSGSWGCCQCNTLNGFYREVCKFCAHARCYYPPMVIEATEELDDLDFEIPTGSIDKSRLN